MNDNRPFKILFLCTGNSARSIFGEYFIRKLGKGKFESHSAGADPRPEVNPYTLRVLKEAYKIDASNARPKSWDLYEGVKFDFVITVCDNAREQCPFWPGQPIIAHWSSADPAAFQGTEEETYRYFWQISQQIYRRVDLFCNLPFEKLDRLRLEHATREIGETETNSSTNSNGTGNLK
jgi:arsenate reductase (thioredoxin)